MRVKLEPETAFIGKKFAYIFLGLIFGLNTVTLFGSFILKVDLDLFKKLIISIGISEFIALKLT